MSRYTISNGICDVIVVGWDNPLNTYFLQVFNYESDEDDIIFSLGQKFSEYADIDKFQKKLLSLRITLTPEIISCLEKDKQSSLPRTTLQNKINEIFKNT